MRPLASLIVFLLCACSPKQEAPKPKPQTHEVKLRVVSQTVLSDEVLFRLGDEVRSTVVGVSRMADDARYSAVAGQWPEEVPRVASKAEAILALGPDLVIVAGFTAAETLEMLKQASIRTVSLDQLDGFDDFRGNVRKLAEAVDAKDEGEGLIAGFDTRLALIESRRTEAAADVLSFSDGSVAGSATSFDDATQAAGFENVAATHGIKGHSRIGLEDLVTWDPGYVVIPCGEVECAVAERTFAAQPGVGRTRAVLEHHVIGIESSVLYSTSAGMLDLAETLQRRKEVDD